MKFAAVLTLPLVASAAVLETRQSKAAGFVDMKPSKYPARLHATAQRTESRYGRKLIISMRLFTF